MAKVKIPRTEQIRMLKSKGMSEKDAVMASMKRSKSKGESDSPKVSSTHDNYPYGLHLNLEHESMKKLALKDMPKAGSTVHVHAKAKVTHTETRTSDGGEPRHSVGLQITHMKLGSSKARHEGSGNPGTDSGEAE